MTEHVVTLTPEDVVTLSAVFSLALAQTEGTIEDYGSPESLRDAFRTQDTIISLRSRVNAMLPDPTGFFD